RFFLEENSYHPLSLIFSKRFGKYIFNHKDPKVREELPGSKEYLTKTLSIIQKKLKVGGRIISFVVDRKRAEFLSRRSIFSEFKVEEFFSIGPRMGLMVLRRQN
ncbi:MAG: hypothetical protein ACI86H_000458, partial [bacterium]